MADVSNFTDHQIYRQMSRVSVNQQLEENEEEIEEE